ncbi:siroheme synthase CysG [Pleionea mediterranea]|uniref:Siroheme synthase n=1 Tax=Pleionea mediterranea TaxID=523701 RepID=A0A316FZX9_9GAMM|nr:siroheme synthase CysG [Pleionea mediterranea]PWK54254.1 uroporphyrinogen-III C-methyltransferase /precorrin-2 dehydrogenase [Pleionea mediterranea]
MDFFPIFTQLRGRQCLVVGAGEVAARKIELLNQAGALITVIAKRISSTVEQMAQSSNNIQLIEDTYSEHYLTKKWLVISATDDQALNQQIAEQAEQQQIFANVVDNAPLCSFITPAIIDRSPITIAISTGGKAPVLARLLRGRLESLIPAAYGRLAKLADKFRLRVKQTLTTGMQRKAFWEQAFEGDIAEKVFDNKHQQAEQQLTQLLNQHKYAALTNMPSQSQGSVYLIGAGPGDPDLLTFKALRLMQKADVVVYDRLVSEPILNLVRRDAERIYVGKQKAQHCVPQDKINELLIHQAQQGKRVVRLKGGDPYIFGRGGEEAQQLVDAGISFDVVPGITSAAGASTYCGIPLTHRDYAQSVTFATGHLKNNSVDLNWTALAQSNNTLVIYMGLTGLAIIGEKLIEQGLTPSMPVAVIQNATQDNQKVVIGTLKNIAQRVKQAQITSPAIIIIGEVVKLYNRLNVQNDNEYLLSKTA